MIPHVSDFKKIVARDLNKVIDAVNRGTDITCVPPLEVAHAAGRTQIRYTAQGFPGAITAVSDTSGGQHIYIVQELIKVPGGQWELNPDGRQVTAYEANDSDVGVDTVVWVEPYLDDDWRFFSSGGSGCVDAATLAGSGLVVEDVSGDCDRLAVALGCHLELTPGDSAGESRVSVDPGSLAGPGLVEVETSGECTQMAVAAGCHLDYDLENNLVVTTETLAGEGLVSEVDSGCDRLAVDTEPYSTSPPRNVTRNLMITPGSGCVVNFSWESQDEIETFTRAGLSLGVSEAGSATAHSVDIDLTDYCDCCSGGLGFLCVDGTCTQAQFATAYDCEQQCCCPDLPGTLTWTLSVSNPCIGGGTTGTLTRAMGGCYYDFTGGPGSCPFTDPDSGFSIRLICEGDGLYTITGANTNNIGCPDTLCYGHPPTATHLTAYSTDPFILVYTASWTDNPNCYTGSVTLTITE